MNTYKELQSLSTEELKERYDNLAKTTQVGLSFYREEISRREQEKQNKCMVKMTRQMRNMTIGITLLTVVNVIILIIELLKNK